MKEISTHTSDIGVFYPISSYENGNVFNNGVLSFVHSFVRSFPRTTAGVQSISPKFFLNDSSLVIM